MEDTELMNPLPNRQHLCEASTLYSLNDLEDVKKGMVRIFGWNFTLEDAINSHSCSLQALSCL
jgi:hypothetical protein